MNRKLINQSMNNNNRQVFDYSSAFSYRRQRSLIDGENEDYYDDNNDIVITDNNITWFQELLYFIIVIFSSLFFILTFPVTSIFCIKKIQSLQRCLIYRLGRRLPLKGPGLILTLPFIDKVSIIDLYENRFHLIEHEQQILTGDGSIVVLKPCQATLSVINALLTSLKLNKNVDVRNFLRLRFTNLIQSKHVEDLEGSKLEFIVKEFEEKMNEFLKNWGYAIGMIELPRITVIDRADPVNPIKSRLKKLLGEDDDDRNPNEQLMLQNLMQDFLNPMDYLSPTMVKNGEPSSSSSQSSSKDILPVLATFIQHYEPYLKGYEELNIKVIIGTNLEQQQISYYQYQKSQNLRQISNRENLQQIHISIQFKDQTDLEQFMMTKDLKYLTFKIH